MPDLLAAGRLREAKAAAASLPVDAGDRVDAMQQVEAAQRRLDQLIAAARAALAVPDEARAETLLKEAALISAEDAATELGGGTAAAACGPARRRRRDDAVRLFWRPAPGHDPDTVYVGPPGRAAPPAHRAGRRASRCTATAGTPARMRVPRWRGRSEYAVFALAEGRPSSRPAAVSVTLLPPVSQLKAEVGPAIVALHWSAHPDAAGPGDQGRAEARPRYRSR